MTRPLPGSRPGVRITDTLDLRPAGTPERALRRLLPIAARASALLPGSRGPSDPGATGDGLRDLAGLFDPGAVSRLLAAAPFSGRAQARIAHVSGRAVRPGVVACVPARNEAERLPLSLSALDAALARTGKPCAILVLVNNSADGSVDIVRAWSARASVPVLVIEARLEASIADAGHARRLALDLAALVATDRAALLSTDADTRVGRDWARRLVGHLHAGAGAAAGMIDVEPEEFAALPERVRTVERLERGLFREHARTWRMLVPDAPQALALRVGGASLAVDAAAYRRVGGLPPLASSEDRAMIAAMLRHDERIVFDERATIRTSCRLEARVADGMAGMLRGRMACEDPFCDQDLHPARRFAWLCLAWHHVRNGRAGDPRGAATVAAALHVDAALLERGTAPWGVAWDTLLRALPPVPRLRASEVEHELSCARALRHTLRAVGPSASVADYTRALGAGEGLDTSEGADGGRSYGSERVRMRHA